MVPANLFTCPLEHSHLSQEIACQVFAEKFVSGGEPADRVLPLNTMLTNRWSTDAHFSQYVAEPSARVNKADAADYQLTFSFCAFDLDFAEHKRLPTAEDFERLVFVFEWARTPKPAIVYPTRGGARAIWLIVPTHDAEFFEQHTAVLRDKVGKEIGEVTVEYEVDRQCGDWNRLFRVPRCVRGGVAEFDTPVLLYRNQVRRRTLLDLETFKSKRKKKPKPATFGRKAYLRNDLRLLHLLGVELTEGSRNTTTFKALCHAMRTYRRDAAEQWIATIREAALNAGLPENEYESIFKSALQQKVNDK